MLLNELLDKIVIRILWIFRLTASFIYFLSTFENQYDSLTLLSEQDRYLKKCSSRRVHKGYCYKTVNYSGLCKSKTLLRIFLAGFWQGAILYEVISVRFTCPYMLLNRYFAPIFYSHSTVAGGLLVMS